MDHDLQLLEGTVLKKIVMACFGSLVNHYHYRPLVCSSKKFLIIFYIEFLKTISTQFACFNKKMINLIYIEAMQSLQ